MAGSSSRRRWAARSWAGWGPTGALGSQSRIQLLHEPVLRHRPDDLVNGLAVLEQEQHRDRHDVVLRRRLRVVVHIELHNAQVLAALRLKLLEMGSDDAAGAAPGGPEVDQ